MRHTFLPKLMTLSLAVVAVGACGGEDDPAASGPTGVGRHGGDCVDGAERCTDAFGAELCPIQNPSGYDGDDLRLCKPKSVDEGLFLHSGPKNYDDPDELAKFTIAPFSEIEECVYVRTTNKKPVYVDGYHGRMRPMSHHLIVTIAPELPEGVELGEPAACDQGEAIGSRWLLGSQDPQIDIAVEGSNPGSAPVTKADHEWGAGQRIEPNTLLRIDLHYLNASPQELLREGWIVLNTVPEEDVKQLVDMVTFFQGNISLPPNSTGIETAVARCKAPEDRFLHMVTGHFHEHGTRFTIWHEPFGGDPYKIYETVDWDVPGNAFFSDRIENPDFDGSEVWGAHSGYIKVKKGDYISFQCEFDNPSDKRVTLGELGTDQMCNVFGLYYPSDGDVWDCSCLGELCI